MITSQMDLRVRQNYDYNSRSWIARIALKALKASDRMELARNDSVALEAEGPGLPAGTLRGASVAAPPVGAGPNQREGVFAFVVEEVGVDRGVEARIVELEA